MSKEFIIEKVGWSYYVQFYFMNYHEAQRFAITTKEFEDWFNISLKQGEKKRIRITIEEIK